MLKKIVCSEIGKKKNSSKTQTVANACSVAYTQTVILRI